MQVNRFRHFKEKCLIPIVALIKRLLEKPALNGRQLRVSARGFFYILPCRFRPAFSCRQSQIVGDLKRSRGVIAIPSFRARVIT